MIAMGTAKKGTSPRLGVKGNFLKEDGGKVAQGVVVAKSCLTL